MKPTRFYVKIASEQTQCVVSEVTCVKCYMVSDSKNKLINI